MSTGREDLSAELIKLAYSIVVEPKKLYMMQSLLDQNLHWLYDDSAVDEGKQKEPISTFQDVETHFQNAMDMMESKGRQGESDSIGKSIIDSDARPAALVHLNGTVSHANEAAQNECGFQSGKPIDNHIFEAGEHKSLMRDLKSLARSADNNFIGMYNCFSLQNDRPIKLVLSKVEDMNGRVIGRISSMNVSWQENIGRQFQTTLKLTPVELEITRAVVSGQNLRELAELRGRSIGTLRNQMKRLLTKLDLSSKTELVTLYSGFSQVSRAPYYQEAPLPQTNKVETQEFSFERNSGVKLAYETIGDDDATPVLYFHPMIGGTAVTDEMKEEITKHNLRLIMPWRPYFKDTRDNGPSETIVERYAVDIERLLNFLNIDSCTMFSGNEASIYGYAVAQHMPERISSMFVTAGAIPLVSRQQFKAMAAHQRIPHFISRYMPSVMDMYVRSIMAMLDAGYDEEFITRFFQESPADQEIILSKDLKPVFRESTTFAFMQGYKAVSNELHLSASKWGRFLEGITMPVSLVSGEQDSEFPISTLETFVKDRPNFTLTVIKDAGTLVTYQKPQAVFQELSHLIARTKK